MRFHALEQLWTHYKPSKSDTWPIIITGIQLSPLLRAVDVVKEGVQIQVTFTEQYNTLRTDQAR